MELALGAAGEMGVEDHAVVAVRGGNEMLWYLSNVDHASRLILLGLGMSGRASLEALLEVRAEEWLVSAVLFCSSTGQTDVLEAYDSRGPYLFSGCDPPRRRCARLPQRRGRFS